MDASPSAYVDRLVAVFAELRRVLAKDGTLWLNLGDSYAGQRGGGQGRNSQRQGRSIVQRVGSKGGVGLKRKDLIGIPWRVAFALQADGWYLRRDIIWQKPNCMPEFVRDRPTSAHEYVFLLSRSARYFYDGPAIAEPTVSQRGSGNIERKQRPTAPDSHTGEMAGSIPWKAKDLRAARSVWTIRTKPFPGAHFATMPLELARRCVLAGSSPGDLIIDPFCGAATSGLAALQEGRRFVGIDLNHDYLEISRRRLEGTLCPELDGLGLVAGVSG